MYCGQCGKQLKDNMLFCPYCGTPVSVPDEDTFEPAPDTDEFVSLFGDDFDNEPVSSQTDEPDYSGERVTSLFDRLDDFDDLDDEGKNAPEEFKPLDFAYDTAEPTAAEGEAPADIPADIPEAPADIPAEEPETAPKRRENTVIRTPENAKSRANKTFIPVQDVNPDNIFMDEPDEYDAYDAEEPVFEEEDDFEYEDREEGGFFRRHIRGIVGLLLMLVLLAICFIWASTTKGQTVLAKMNLAWDAEVYAELGYQAYQNNSDLQAARYYEKAYSRDTDNYTYAHSAMVAYYDANQLDKATSMLKICVSLQPNNPEPYSEFLILYPDAENRPWEITQVINDGYQRTGDQRLNIG